MKFEKLFESKNHKLYKVSGEEVPITPKMAVPLKWSDVEGEEEQYNEAFLASFRDLLKGFEEKGEFVFVEPVYDKNANPGQFTAAMKHTSRRIKDCACVIGFALPEQVVSDVEVAQDFIEKLSEKHPQYVYFAKNASDDRIVLY